MPYYYRRRSRSRWPYRSWRGGSVYRAQTNGTRRFSVAIPVSGQVNIPVSNGTLFTNVFSFFPFASYTNASRNDLIQSCLGNLYLNNIWYSYCQLYDEVKLNSFSVRLSVLSVPIDGKGAFVESCLDRHANVADMENPRSQAQVQNSAEVQNNQFTSLERATVFRYYRARDVGERTNFFDCTSVDVVDTAHDPAQWGRRQVQDWALGGGGNFSPCLSFYIRLLSPPADGSNVLISYNVVWNLTFRNPKASVGAAARGLTMSDLRLDDVKVESEGEKFDEIVEKVIKKMKEGDGDVVVVKRESEVLPDDDLMDSQPAG